MIKERTTPTTDSDTTPTLKEIRDMFDDVMIGVSDPDRRAKLALLREYFTNPGFRSELSEYLFNQAS